MITRTDALDDALERLAGFSYLDAPGVACHGPMGAETLCALGRDDLVGGWVDRYTQRHEPLPAPPPTMRIDPNNDQAVRSALGDPLRLSDWHAMFRNELSEGPWPEVIGRWVPRLLPGYAGALTHGLIRTAHAVRAIPTGGEPSALLCDELAKGLALWAGSFKVLPGQPKLTGSVALPDAIAQLPRPPQPWSMMEAGTFARLDELDGFAPAIEALAPPEATGQALSTLSASFCRMLLDHPDAFAVPLVHTATPIGAVRILLPQLAPEAVDGLYALLWHVSAAITVSFTTSPAAPSVALGTEPPPVDEILARAIAHQDPHVMKFTDACTQEHWLNPDPIYLHAAHHVLDQLPGW